MKSLHLHPSTSSTTLQLANTCLPPLLSKCAFVSLCPVSLCPLCVSVSVLCSLCLCLSLCPVLCILCPLSSVSYVCCISVRSHLTSSSVLFSGKATTWKTFQMSIMSSRTKSMTRSRYDVIQNFKYSILMYTI